jgi:hypothetical protein
MPLSPSRTDATNTDSRRWSSIPIRSKVASESRGILVLVLV